jgi:hypothetical protein
MLTSRIPGVALPKRKERERERKEKETRSELKEQARFASSFYV